MFAGECWVSTPGTLGINLLQLPVFAVKRRLHLLTELRELRSQLTFIGFGGRSEAIPARTYRPCQIHTEDQVFSQSGRLLQGTCGSGTSLQNKHTVYVLYCTERCCPTGKLHCKYQHDLRWFSTKCPLKVTNGSMVDSRVEVWSYNIGFKSMAQMIWFWGSSIRNALLIFAHFGVLAKRPQVIYIEISCQTLVTSMGSLSKEK